MFPKLLSSVKQTAICFHLHAAVGHRHGIVRQGIAGHLAVIGAADGSERAHMAGAEGVSSLVRPVRVTAAEIQLVLSQRLETFQQVGDIHYYLNVTQVSVF